MAIILTRMVALAYHYRSILPSCALPRRCLLAGACSAIPRLPRCLFISFRHIFSPPRAYRFTSSFTHSITTLRFEASLAPISRHTVSPGSFQHRMAMTLSPIITQYRIHYIPPECRANIITVAISAISSRRRSHTRRRHLTRSALNSRAGRRPLHDSPPRLFRLVSGYLRRFQHQCAAEQVSRALRTAHQSGF